MPIVKKLNAKIVINVALTAHEWELCKPSSRAAEIVAAVLNKALNDAVNSNLCFAEVQDVMYDVMERRTGVGASDSEPEAVLAILLDYLFPRGQ